MTTSATTLPRAAAPEPLAVSAADAATLLGIGRTNFLGLVASGRAPPGIKLGRRRLWAVVELQEWLAAGAPHRDQWEKMKA